MSKRKLVKMQAEIDSLQGQVTGLIKTVTELLPASTPAPKLKTLDQSDFSHKFVTDDFKYAVLNENGQTIFFSSKPFCDVRAGEWRSVTGSFLPMLNGYDATDWQNSLIERDIAKELTGSELCRAMLARGDKYVLCHLSQTSEKSAKDVLGIAIGHDHSGFRVQRHNSWQYAVPINNNGEPLTASEVGL